MTDIEYAKRLEHIVENYQVREDMLDAIDFLKHRYIVEREQEKAEAQNNVRK